MRFDIITIFPHIFDAYFNESIIKRGQEKKLIKIVTHDLRKYTRDKHKKTDNTPYGGGAGMVMTAEPILRAVNAVARKNKNQKTKIVLFSAKGRSFNQKIAYEWSQKYNRVIFVTGRYEGIDERAAQILKKEYKKDFEEISIGPYVLIDGDVAAMVVVSAVSRLISGVIRTESLEESRYGAGLPTYTRPEVLKWPIRPNQGKQKIYRVPKVLLSGDHKKIAEWRRSHIS